MNLNEAIAAAYAGKKIRHKTWTGQGMFVCVKNGVLWSNSKIAPWTLNLLNDDYHGGFQGWEIVPPPILLKDLKVGQRFRFNDNPQSVYKLIVSWPGNDLYILLESSSRFYSMFGNEFREVELVD